MFSSNVHEKTQKRENTHRDSILCLMMEMMFYSSRSSRQTTVHHHAVTASSLFPLLSANRAALSRQNQRRDCFQSWFTHMSPPPHTHTHTLTMATHPRAGTLSLMAERWLKNGEVRCTSRKFVTCWMILDMGCSRDVMVAWRRRGDRNLDKKQHKYLTVNC